MDSESLKSNRANILDLANQMERILITAGNNVSKLYLLLGGGGYCTFLVMLPDHIQGGWLLHVRVDILRKVRALLPFFRQKRLFSYSKDIKFLYHFQILVKNRQKVRFLSFFRVFCLFFLAATAIVAEITLILLLFRECCRFLQQSFSMKFTKKH